MFLQNSALLIPDRRATSSASSSSSSLHHHHQNLAFQSKQASFPTHDENAFSSNQHHQHQHQPHSHPHHHLSQQVISDIGRPEFSSAFGLLSLDDPNVLAGIATDGTPFFDDPNQAHNQARNTTSDSTTTTSDVVQLGGGNGLADMDTPMPMKQDSGQLQSPSLEEGQKIPVSATGAGIENSRERDSKELKEFWKQ